MTHYDKMAQLTNAILSARETIELDGTVYKLPTPQRSGTAYQKRGYAMQSATKLLNN